MRACVRACVCVRAIVCIQQTFRVSCFGFRNSLYAVLGSWVEGRGSRVWDTCQGESRGRIKEPLGIRISGHALHRTDVAELVDDLEHRNLTPLLAIVAVRFGVWGLGFRV
jgi:hypothetical protein